VPGAKGQIEGCRMQELVKVTGVPKSTILFYRAQGLLPPPLETGPNSALYDPACVERIRFIRGLQANHRLTLAEIRERLAAGEAGGLKSYLRLEETTFDRAETDKRLSRTAFCRATGLQPAEIDELAGAGLLRPLVQGSFDADDVAMGRGYREALAAGTQAADLRFYVELGEAIVAAELALLNRAPGRPHPAKAAAARTRMAKLARMCRTYVADRIFQLRVAATKTLKDEGPPVRPEPEREPWLD
jgi:DNA-binding transcriptional MerR regulator